METDKSRFGGIKKIINGVNIVDIFTRTSDTKEENTNQEVQDLKDFKEAIEEFGRGLDIDPYMSFVVSYFKSNKDVNPTLEKLDRSDLLEKYNRKYFGKEKDTEILKYCFDYSDKNTHTLTKTYKDYILDKDLVEFCMDKVNAGGTKKGENIKISQCTIPTFVLYNPLNYKVLIDYANFESLSKYKALGEILTTFSETKTLDLRAKCKSSILISPRVFMDDKGNMLKDIKTDTQLIEEELKTLDTNGNLYAILPADWLTKDEEAKRRLIANNFLKTVLELPTYKMHRGKDLIWLHFNKDRHSTDDIIVYEKRNMNYSNETEINMDSKCLQQKMHDCKKTFEGISQFLKRFDDDNKRTTIARLYGEYIRIIEKRFPTGAKEIISIIREEILMPLHFTPTTKKENEFAKEESDILKEERALGNKIGRIILTKFLDSFVEHKLIDAEDYNKLSSDNNKIKYITYKPKPAPESEKTETNKPAPALESPETNSTGNFKFKNYKGEQIELKPFEHNIPEFVENTLTSMRDLGNFGSHTDKNFENTCTIRRNECTNLKNSIISCCFNFLDVLQWYNKFLKEIEEEKKREADCNDLNSTPSTSTSESNGTPPQKTTPKDKTENDHSLEEQGCGSNCATFTNEKSNIERFLIKINNGTKYCKYKDGKAKFAPSYAVKAGEYVQILEIKENESHDRSEYKYFVNRATKIKD